MGFNRASVPKNPIFWKNRIFNRAVLAAAEV
jgi:hypothetical protein